MTAIATAILLSALPRALSSEPHHQVDFPMQLGLRVPLFPTSLTLPHISHRVSRNVMESPRKKHLLLPGKIEQTHLVITIKQICCPMVIISITRTIHRPVTSNTKAMDPPATQQAPDEQ